MEFAGEFETHVTVHTETTVAVEALRDWARGRGLGFHHIVLDRGRTLSQPMVSRRGCGTLFRESAAAIELTRELADAGFTVTRVKIEAAPTNRDVPQSDADAASHPGRYFEHHIKLALDARAEVAALAMLVGRHAAHLSRNALRVRDDGRRERFVTQRCHGVGAESAGEALRELLAALEGYAVLSVEEEFVVQDSNPAMDSGWLEKEGES